MQLRETRTVNIRNQQLIPDLKLLTPALVLLTPGLKLLTDRPQNVDIGSHIINNQTQS